MLSLTGVLLQHGPMGPHNGAMGGAAGGWLFLLIGLVIGVIALGCVVLYMRGQRDSAKAEADSLETLKQQYAVGEIDDAEFEERCDRLLQRQDS